MKNLLHHVKDFFRPIEPNIVVWNCHCLEGDLLCILEIRVRPPDPVEPLYRQKLVFSCHVGGKPQSVIIPLLSEEYIRHVSLNGQSKILNIHLSQFSNGQDNVCVACGSWILLFVQ